jgi:hypothetical protein
MSQQLERSLKFTQEDLAMNREGRMSPAQRAAWKPPRPNQLAVMVIGGHVLLIGGLLGLIALITGKAALWIVVLIVVGLTLLPFVLMQNEGNIRPALRNDVAQGKVACACGIAILQRRQGRQISYDLSVGGVTVSLTAAQAGAFRNQEQYCIYYLPHSLTLVSAEELSLRP